jgi:hypothetical protein
LPEWLYEDGIGESRAILVEENTILEAAIELPDDVRVGTVLTGHLRDLGNDGKGGWISAPPKDVFLPVLPSNLTKGQLVRVEVIREQILEPRFPKSLVGRVTDQPARPGPSLAERIGRHKALSPSRFDLFEQAGWSDVLEEAISGEIYFDGGQVRLSLTPAMTLLDVDGQLPLEDLAIAGARAAASGIRRHGVGGSIGIDLPTVTSRGTRQKAAAAIDEVLPQPFERTAVNGFGFVQVVRKRERQSLPEMLQYNPVGSAARALLRRAERVSGAGARLLNASPSVIEFLESRSDWIDELRNRIGSDVWLQAERGRTTWSFHVQAAHT